MPDTARELVEKMVAAGEWPDPRLLEDILAQGEAAVEPLREVVRREAHGWPDEAPLCFAIDMLGTLGAAAAVPDLVPLFGRYDNETVQSLSTTLGVIGEPAFDAVLAAVRDPALNSFQRAEATTAALMAADGNDALRQRVATVLRDLLADYVARAGQLSEEDVEMASFLVADLTQLADPEARETIDAAFKANIVDTHIMRPEDVDYYYGRKPEEIPRPEPRAWLEEYRELYEEELEARETRDDSPEDADDAAKDDDPGGREGPPPVPPFEHSGPRIGRNDPCWCGSGKKYKNCHYELDRAE